MLRKQFHRQIQMIQFFKADCLLSECCFRLFIRFSRLKYSLVSFFLERKMIICRKYERAYEVYLTQKLLLNS